MKKLFAIVLSLVMVLSLLPVTAMAEETVIDEISFTGTLPELEVGDTLPDVSAAFAVPDGANYTVSAQWWDNIANADAAAGDAVEQGDSYDLLVNIKVKTGYEFEDTGIPISFNDEDAGSVFTDCMPVDSGEPDHILIEFEMRQIYEFRPVIDKVEISFTEPALGEVFSEITIPGDANYVFSDEFETGWFDENWNPATVAETDHAYHPDVYLEVKEGCLWANTDDISIFVNGVDMTDHDDMNAYMMTNGVFNIYPRYSFMVKLDKVELTVPTIGEGDTVFGIDDITVPEDVPYTVQGLWWYDEDGHIAPDAVLEKGKKYRYEIELWPEQGYEFDEGNMDTLINGEKVDGDGDADYWHAYGELNLKTIITAVDLPDVLPDELKVGDPISSGLIKDEEGYSVYRESVQHGVGYVPDGAAAEEAVYALMLLAEAKEGYEFSEDVVITVGGEPLPDTLFKNFFSDEVRYGKLYVLDDTQLIDKVEITVDKPEIGKEGGKPSVAEDAPYELDEFLVGWSVADSNDVDEMDELEGVFEEGQHAWLVTALFAKDGYLFADDVEVYVNGKKIELDGGTTAMYDGSMMVCANYMGQLAKEGAPATADNAPLVLWVVMLTVSAMGAVYMVSKKRYAK